MSSILYGISGSSQVSVSQQMLMLLQHITTVRLRFNAQAAYICNKEVQQLSATTESVCTWGKICWITMNVQASHVAQSQLISTYSTQPAASIVSLFELLQFPFEIKVDVDAMLNSHINLLPQLTHSYNKSLCPISLMQCYQNWLDFIWPRLPRLTSWNDVWLSIKLSVAHITNKWLVCFAAVSCLQTKYNQIRLSLLLILLVAINSGNYWLLVAGDLSMQLWFSLLLDDISPCRRTTIVFGVADSSLQDTDFC